MLIGETDEKVIEIAEYVAATGATVRAAAKRFGVSKSTVHKYLTERLRRISPEMYGEVCRVLAKNRAERHIRGGMATKAKYCAERDKKCKKVDKRARVL